MHIHRPVSDLPINFLTETSIKLDNYTQIVGNNNLYIVQAVYAVIIHAHSFRSHHGTILEYCVGV